MPIFDFGCSKCGVVELLLWQSEKLPSKCPHCGGRPFKKLLLTAPTVFGDRADWSNHNGGRGEYCPQLARFPKDPTAWYQSAGDVAKEGKRRGYTVHKDA